MKKLSERNATLLLQGAKMEGLFKEGYRYVEEELYMDEAQELFAFCGWIDDNVGGASRFNIASLFQAFKHPNNVDLQKFVADLKRRIDEIKSYTVLCNV